MIVKKQHLLGVLDNGLSLFVFAPLVVGYWRGTWGLLDIYLYPDELPLTFSVSLTLGIGGSVVLYFSQVPLTGWLKKENKLVWIFCFHLYTYVFAFCAVNHWRGVWGLWDHFTGTTWQSAWISTGIGLVILWLLRAGKTLTATPVALALDTYKDFFECTTRFRTKPRFEKHYFFDVLFTVAVIHSLVVFFWRGVFTLLNNYIFPEDFRLSAFTSLAIGYGIEMIIFPLQYVTNLAYNTLMNQKYPYIYRVVLEDILYTVANVAAVCIWRGIWYCSNIFILPNNPTASNWLTHGVGIGGLMLCLNGNSVVTRGVRMDGEPVTYSEQGAVFPNEFLRYFLRKKEATFYREKTGTSDPTCSNIDSTSLVTSLVTSL